MDNKNVSCFGIDLRQPLTNAAYKGLWTDLPKIRIELVEKIGQCPHEEGDVFFYENPYKLPQNLCYALLHVLNLYTWRVSLGFPSWDENHPGSYRIHCPDPTGTIWEMKVDE